MMPRLNKKTKKIVISLINKNRSLNQISSVTGVGKTTIYYYMRNILGRKIKLLIIDKTNIERIGEIIGLFAGDGNYYHDKKRWVRRITFSFNKKDSLLISYYIKSLSLLTNKLPNVYCYENVRILALRSKEFSQFLFDYLFWGDNKTKTVELRNKSLLKNKKFVIGFMRGLIDSDGHIRKGRREIQYATISKNLFSDFLDGLDFFDFKYKIYLCKRIGRQDLYKVILVRDDVDRFNKIIKPLRRL